MSHAPNLSAADLEREKEAAAVAAAALVEDGMRCVATSPRTEDAARALGLQVEPFGSIERFDVTVDGADQVSPDGWLVKGGGGAHTREKLVAVAADRFVVIADSTKPVIRLGPPVPMELLAFGLASTMHRLGPVRLRDAPLSPDGGVIVVLESLEHAQARGARSHAELVGYGVTADGQDMVQPSGEGAVRCMRQALAGVSSPIQYLNTHGTSTPLGDVIELKAVREVFGASMPPISSTKSLSGHSLGAAGVQEAIYCLLMMRDGFVAGSANIDELDRACTQFPILRATEQRRVDTVMSNSFGFGGTNATLIFQRY